MQRKHHNLHSRVTLMVFTALALVLLAGCNQSDETPAPASPTDTPAAATAPSLPDAAASPEAVAAVSAEPPTATPVDTATSTPSPSATPTETPGATETPTATATPTQPPSQALAEARHLHDNGDYAGARQLFAELIQAQPDSPEGQEARWRLGLAYLEDEQPTEAVVALELARQQTPPAALPVEIDFWIGQALGEIGNPTGAVEAYRRYLANDDTLAGEVNLRIGRHLLEAGDNDAAITAFDQAVATAADNFVLFAAQEDLAGIYHDRGDTAAAVAQLDAIVGRSQFARYRAELQQRAGQWLADAGDSTAALDRYRRAIAEEETSPGALNAANALAAAGQPLDDYTYARILLGNGLYADGIATMYRYFDATPDHPAEPHLQVAEAYFSQREYTSALAEWQNLLDTHPEYSNRAGVLIRMAVANSRLGNTATARSLYKQAGTPAALLEAARVSEREGDCQTAATEYLDLARLYPAAADAGEALYRAGVCQYELGQTEAAVDAWQRLVDGYQSNTYAHAGRFWAGKGALELGDAARAGQLWQGLANEAADSYYTARAAEIAAGSDQLAVISDQWKAMGTASSNAAATDDELQSDAEQWLTSWAAPGSDPVSLRQLPAEVAADPQLARGEAYLRAGMRGEALRELDELRERYNDSPLAQYALALHFRDLGLYRHATLAAVRTGALSPAGLFASPLFIQRMAYPTYFSDLVEAEAAARGLDPLLIYSLIRQESFFERGARSFAAAQGLTQVIPSTAEWIANAIGWPNFQPDDIYKPYINVKFGTYYLFAALEMFDGNPYPALVGYNAGPGNAQYWLDQAATDDNDLYVEEISISEPKLYVRRVLAHLANYQRLYGK
ncbi:MAG: tetratricopeptide repeat protein [Anaerolineales bacterium]|nr:tetratricopeptide repeat protein [Anaerolineales bacterium]